MVSRRLARPELAIRTSFWLLMALMSFGASLPLLQRYEPVFFPVVEDFRITAIRRDGEDVVISGDMIKRRECRFVSLTFYAGDPHDLTLARERLHVRFEDQPGDADLTREPGRQNWGPWRLSPPHGATGGRVFMRVNHDCHPFWTTSAIYLSTDIDSLFDLTTFAPARAPSLPMERDGPACFAPGP